MKFGQRVHALRTEKKYSRRELAGLADMDESHLARVERGQVNPSLHMILQLSVALEVAVGVLMDGISGKDLPESRRPYTIEDFRRQMKRQGTA
ncbi:MAG TPA: helix-turn-helix transcriptional regulator [Terrimesophilobacter sp.]|nr:helix-turn-helix transcriptional regulator [Terrimesophilobacter sp.]HRP99556.1 helix-turn-helix transcriptional regulator [Terrimesophilobacter sp.]